MLPTPPPVTVTLDGAIVASSEDASLLRGTVVAPVSPFLDALAARYVLTAGGALVIERAGHRITIRLGDRTGVIQDEDSATPRRVDLVVAPRECAGVVIVPLAAVARALGYRARFLADAVPVLAIERGEGVAVATAAPETAPPGPYETFEPRVIATPARPLPSIVPQPRRTPIHETDGS